MGELSCVTCVQSSRFSTSNLQRRDLVVCAASPGSTNPTKRTGGPKPKRASKRGSSSSKYKDEEIYSIKHGWTIKSDANDKVLEAAGLQFPASINKVETGDAPHAQEPRSLHKLLRVMGGKVARKKLLSCSGLAVRPMMEVVRGAVFNMLQARGGYAGGLPPGRWLDLYCGTGSVGIEALSRGCVSAHFIELDPWVVSNVLEPNLKATNLAEQSVIHTMRVETYLDKQAAKRSAEPFEYISVTPPYELVHYPTLMEQLSNSPLVGEDTSIIVEYPLKSKNEMPDKCGPLCKIVDRRYGRTHLAIYGASVE